MKGEYKFLEDLLCKLEPEDRKKLALETRQLYLEEQARRKVNVTNLELILTERCNLACDYCFITRHCQRRDMTPELIDASLKFLYEHAPEEGEVKVTLFGGEPLLVMLLFKYTVTKARELAKPKQNISFALTTNATLITPEIAQYLAEEGIMALLSIDGTRELHDKHRTYPDGRGSYDDVLKGWETLRNYQPWMGVRMTFTPDNISHMAECVEYLNQRGINQFILGIGEAPDLKWDEAALAELDIQWRKVAAYYRETLEEGKLAIRIGDFEETEEDLKQKYTGRFGCGAGNNQLCITPDGTIYPCSRFTGLNDGAGVYALGNVLKEGVERHDLLADLQDMRGIVRNACTNCEIIDTCGGTCAAVNYETNCNIYCITEGECALQKIKRRIAAEQPDLINLSKEYPFFHAIPKDEMTSAAVGAEQSAEEKVAAEV